MRLWSIHPKYLDTKGLVAVWREALLAKKVLEGNTKGYKNHPQLVRFKNYSKPLKAINAYLFFIWQESNKRGYNFSSHKIIKSSLLPIIKVTNGQIEFEFLHLLEKLKTRDKGKFNSLKNLSLELVETHPIFKKVSGKIEKWEKSGKIPLKT
ncbi:pyrimidine dimer DNA glycosylase/endonuclease V [Melioribacteraceae bacterium 4301-Me]|uniref:pyrimidine dimer DNA glycosylase/endonuclease V n=1 Tax=Pyranulibacter aquaticus TaxID=3163344 RepID=UPI00359817F6